MKFTRLRRRPDLLRGMAAGLIGGLVGGWTMNQFQAVESKVRENCSGTSGQEQKSESDDATTKTAAWLLDSLAGIELSKKQRKTAGPIVHYAFGAAMGALYGGLMEYKRRSSPADGAMWGTALFVGADELTVPALGLSEPPTKYPLSVHASALTAHLLYGLTTELVRRKTRRALMLV